jgi:PAS domain S-box-containing protein
LISGEADASAFLTALVGSSDDAIVGKSLEGIVRSWNQAAERLFGYTAQEMIGRSISAVIPNELMAEETLFLERIRNGERIEHFETTRRAKSGELLFVSLTISPVIDAQGRIVGASKIARDLTERRRVERALRASETSFRTLADSIAQLAWMADAGGSLFWYNARWLEYTGLSLEELSAAGWSATHHPDHLAQVTEKFRAAIAQGITWEDTFPLRGRDGRYRWFLSRALPIRDENGDVLRWFGTNTDITERMQMEASLREVDQRKNQFLAVLAHELRNPLAPLRAGITLLQSGIEGAAAARVLDTLERQSAQMVRLVDDLMDVSRVTQDKVELRPSDVAVVEVVRTAVETSQSALTEAAIELHVDVPPDLIVYGDTVRLAQVFANLLNNAAKYTPAHGRVTLIARREGNAALVIVADTGIGISADMLERVFEPFVQGHKIGSAIGRGLGVGLSLVKALVELHKGSVEAHSAGEGQGSQFVVRLPMSSAAPTTNTAVEPQRLDRTVPKNDCLRVIIADDNEDAADLMKMMLESWGHDVVAVYDGRAALEQATRSNPDVMLLDLGMPDLDGYEVAREVHDARLAHAPVLIALTGWGQAHDRERTQAVGFEHHLLKPANPVTLRALLDKIAADRRAG